MSTITIIKIGGAALEMDLSPLWGGIARYRTEGPVALIHGGGKQSTSLARRLGHEPTLVHGRRVTTDLDLEIVKMALGGTVNIELVASALAAGLPVVGLSGISGWMVSVQRRPPWKIDGDSIDFGHVGDVVGIDSSVLDALFGSGILPVVACMGIDMQGDVYNVNADTVAAEIASVFPADRLLLVTESGGIQNNAGETVPAITGDEGLAGISEGWIQGGMIVKVRTAISALGRGVKEVRITNPDGVARTHAGTTITEVKHG